MEFQLMLLCSKRRAAKAGRSAAPRRHRRLQPCGVEAALSDFIAGGFFLFKRRLLVRGGSTARLHLRFLRDIDYLIFLPSFCLPFFLFPSQLSSSQQIRSPSSEVSHSLTHAPVWGWGG